MDRKGAKAPPLDWESPPARLSGVGPTAAAALSDVGIHSLADLVWTIPVGFDDLRAPASVGEVTAALAAAGEFRGAVRGIVDSLSVVPMRGRRALRVVLRDEGATLHAWWFFFAHGVHKAAAKGTEVVLVGKVTREGTKPPRMVHPDLLVGELPAVRVRYPRFGIPAATLRKAIPTALAALSALPDPVPIEIAVREGMPSAPALLEAVHRPTEGPPPLTFTERMRERLAWVEVFTRAFDRLRAEARHAGDRRAGHDGVALPKAPTREALEEAFGFTMTGDQARAIEVTSRDLAAPVASRRLLLGDVGTGKTAVALAAAVQAIGSGAQVALLAPTTVLAEQYAESCLPIARAFGVRFAVLLGGTAAAERRRVLQALKTGELDLVVGTHALLVGDVEVPKLGLVVVDEQHRLGVAQRLALVQKGQRPHLLTLSATPIPRTLALAVRGDLPVTTLAEKPRGRPPVVTELASQRDRVALVRRIQEAVADGDQVFVVCPRVETGEDDEDEVASAVERAGELSKALSPTPVALVHGALGHAKKLQAMRAFRSGEARVLVGTTVVEVGVDVPAATLMIVESAERFGLAQLHQLRGRVGRGQKPGRAIFVHESELGAVARERLEALVRFDRGEDIARMDLELRGAGDLWGTRQSGDEEGLRYLASSESPPWLTRIEGDAKRILEADAELTAPEHRALRLLVARFRRIIAVREEAG